MKLYKLQLIILIIINICFTNISFSQCVIVVNKHNPINDISFSELQKIYSGEETNFSSGKNITLLEYKELKEQFYDILFDWSLIKLKKYWMRLIFSGEVSIAPIEYENSNRIIEQIKVIEGAISFIKLSEVVDDVKIITIDGKKPSDKNYLFHKKTTHI